MTREFIRAFKSGSTRPSMVFLAIASLVQAAQFLLVDSVIMSTRKVALSFVADPDFWAYAHILAGMLIFWRLADTVSRPVSAWVVNGLMFGMWLATYISPAVALGDLGALLSVTIILPLMSLWSLIRTEATPRDRMQA